MNIVQVLIRKRERRNMGVIYVVGDELNNIIGNEIIFVFEVFIK